MTRNVISGYVRTPDNMTAVAGANVTIYYHKNNVAVPIAGSINASANPTVTNSNGYFEWSSDLSPGDVYAKAEIGGAQQRIRSGREMMQAGRNFTSDIGRINTRWSNGVASSTVTVVTSSSTNLVSVTQHQGILAEQSYQATGTYNKAIATNPSLAIRKSFFVASQSNTGTTNGEQEFRIVYGTVNNTYPTLPEAGFDQFVLCGFTTNQNALVSTKDPAIATEWAYPVNAEKVVAATFDTTGAILGYGLIYGPNGKFVISNPISPRAAVSLGAVIHSTGVTESIIAQTTTLILDKNQSYDIHSFTTFDVQPYTDETGIELPSVARVDTMKNGVSTADSMVGGVARESLAFRVAMVNGTTRIVRETARHQFVTFTTYIAGTDATDPSYNVITYLKCGTGSNWSIKAKDIHSSIFAVPRA